MKLTRYVHSCVLIESANGNVLFDPGAFSWGSGLVDISTFPVLTAVVVSHGHPDHMSEPFVRALAERFAGVQWFAPTDTHDTLREWGVSRINATSLDNFQIEQTDHAPVEPFAQQVMNLQTHWDGLVTHPGDSHAISRSGKVLLMPFQAPWGTVIDAVHAMTQLKPQYVLPIHDWMWNDQWRQTVYDRLQVICDANGITFLRPTDGQSITVEELA